jgi:alpha-tubulin suppressor-like RCC1 family protein
MCLPCDYGLACSVGSDCITGLCEASTCAHVTAVSVSPTFACALTEGGGVRCWGANDFGQIGDGTASQRLRPTQVSGLTSGVAQVATGDRVACARMTGGEVRCWGTNDKGQVGVNATTTSLFATPQTLTGLTATSIAVAMGGCAISAGGVQCWGDNSRGQVGDGTTTTRYAPVASNVTTGVSAISSQAKTACELGGNRVVECWGDNSSRQLGDGNSNTYETAAVRVLPTAFLSQGPLAVGGDFACAQGYPSFSVACWGSNDHGQMGTGTIGGQNTQATGVSVGASGGLATGTATVCAINSTGGSVACWGKNTSGELGDGTTTDRASPVDITAKLPGIPTSMSIGDASTCAVIGGSLYCWGDNSGGQLGDGSMVNHLAPEKVVF